MAKSEGSGAPAETWPFYPLAFLHDAACCLALADAGVLQFDAQGRLQMSSVSRLSAASMLRPEMPHPVSEAQAPGLSFLVRVLGSGGLIGAAANGDVPAALRLSSTGHEWLGQPGYRQLEQLRQVWWLDPMAAAGWLPPARRRRPLDSHWRQVTIETAGWVAALPGDAWSQVSGLAPHLAARGLTSAGTTINLPRIQQAFERQTIAFGEFLLEVVLPRLGLVGIHRLGGQHVELRAIAEGAAWLRGALGRSELLGRSSSGVGVELSAPSADLRFPAPSEPALTIEPDLQLVVSLVAPAVCTFEIAHVAELLSPGPPARYRLTRDSLRQAVGWGYPVPEVLFLLAHFGNGSVPEPALVQITAWQEEMAVVGCEPGYRLHLAAPEVLSILRQRDPFRQRTLPFASGEDAWVGEAQSPELFRYLRRVGYELEGLDTGLTGPAKQGAAESQGQASPPLRLHTPTPLPQILVVLRTYQHLRRLVPGLADLDLEPLDRAIAAVLAPDDLAGAERLAASHLVFLRHHLRRTPPGEKAVAGDDGAQVANGGAGEAEQGEQNVQEAGNVQEEKKGPWEEQSVELSRSEETVSALRDLEGRLQAAIEADRTLELTYADTKGTASRRRVRPLHLETRWGRRYLLAYCELRQDERRFRLDRIVDVRE